jgi:predicted nucleotidyltransferase
MKAMLPAFRRILERARDGTLDGVRVSAVDPEGLILLKLLAFRERDREDIRAVLAHQTGKLDLGWVREQLAGLTTDDDPTREQFEQMVREYYLL